MIRSNSLIFSLIVLLQLAFYRCESVTIEEEVKPKEDHHPFLIVKKEQFNGLREKSAHEPWKSIKEDAIQRANSGSKTDAYALQYYVGAAALAYILDEQNNLKYAHKVRDAILNQYSELKVQEGNSWREVVPPLSSFFLAILSLDIVYDALTIEEILTCEQVISNQIFKVDRSGSWIDARLGTHGTWDIYKGIRNSPDQEYFDAIMEQITEDGVSPVTNHYAWERVGGGNSRVSKSGYMDVLEFTVIDKRYYNNERLKKFYRWLFGSSVNCAKEMAIFGDMLPTQGINNDMLHRRVVNFDEEAAGYAAWFHEDRPAIGNIITYILPKEPLPEPVVPSSKIYANGGAFFREKEDDKHGLHGVLYNIQSQDEWHTHNEVNGLALSGLGNRLLVNGGRLGAPTRAAELNNTLTINGENHDSRLGGGIIEGFTYDDLDYASGFSGPALSNSSHYRNLVMLHNSETADGYFVIFDEVETEPGSQVKNYLHPANESTVATITQNFEYEAVIDHYPSQTGRTLSFIYGTTPASINIEKVPSAVPDRYPNYPDHNRLEAVYETPESGKKNIVTILIPGQFNSSRPNAQRVMDAGLSGIVLQHDSNTQDVILESSGDTEYTYNGISFSGKSIIARITSEANTFFFIRKGTYFSYKGTGFKSDNPISIYMKGNNGIINSDGAQLTLNGASTYLISFSANVTILDTGENFIKVDLPVGEVEFYL